MHDWAGRYPEALVNASETVDYEFEQRLKDSGTLAFRVAYGVLRHRQDAEDVAQEAFVRAHREFRRLRDRERFRAWLVRTAWRLAIDRWRSERRRGLRERHAAPAAEPTTEQSAVSAERAGALWQAIDRLPEKLRLAIVLSGIQGHDVRETAKLLGVPEGTVKSRLFLARKALSEDLQWLKNT